MVSAVFSQPVRCPLCSVRKRYKADVVALFVVSNVQNALLHGLGVVFPEVGLP